MIFRQFKNNKIRQIYASWPKQKREKLMSVRELIFEIAEQHDHIGAIEETLKWENPAYLTHCPKSGTTVRLSVIPNDEKKYSISVHCQTSLEAEFREIYPELEYDGNRSIILDSRKKIPIVVIRHFLYSALTYHFIKKQ